MKRREEHKPHNSNFKIVGNLRQLSDKMLALLLLFQTH